MANKAALRVKTADGKWTTIPALVSVENGSGEGGNAGAVRYDVPQELTDAEKAQARENIGIETFQGAYEITPHTANDYTLKTAQKLMDGDIHIQKIPYAEVSNTSGGTTATIGEVEE